VNEPLSDANATLLGYKNGSLAIVKWKGGPDAGPNVAWSRQSLAPIVRNGRLDPALNTDQNSYQWGCMLGGVGLVWRTGVAIDRRGNLIVVVADNQTVISPTRILPTRRRRPGHGVRPQSGMAHPDHLHASARSSRPEDGGAAADGAHTRYRTQDERDFFAFYRRVPGAVTVPFK
jgi:hypothetical protein